MDWLRQLGRRGWGWLLVSSLVWGCWLGPVATAEPAMTYLYNAPESNLDVRYLYHWEILRTALEKTREKYGPYRLLPAEPMTERRQAFEMKKASGKLTVMYLDVSADLEENLIPIRIPVDKNLVGYRLLLIRKEDQPRFDSVRSLDDLKKFSWGLESDWIDVGILRASGFKVVTGSNYDGLFEMLVNKRFDVLSRAVVEVVEEFDQRKGAMPGLHIEEHLLLYYPLPMYFWFAKTDEGRRLAARAEEGMRRMIEDGTYDRIFDRYQRRKIERCQLKGRTMFSIPNPNLGPQTPFADKRLWFDLQTYR